MPIRPAPHLPDEALAHYDQVNERDRLIRGTGALELARTQEIIKRHLPAPPAVVSDVGGGPGRYALWLAQAGYQVHLTDAVPLHIEQAREAALAQPQYPISEMCVGDARSLRERDESVDAVLLFGPLYHLTNRADRLKALREAHRVLVPGGVVFAAAISRFASALDGMCKGFLEDPTFRAIVDGDLTDGQHRNPTDNIGYFTTTFFHHPDELRQEVVDAGFGREELLAVEGPAWLLHNFDKQWQNANSREHLLNIIRRIEAEPSLLGMSAHLLAVAHKKQATNENTSKSQDP